MKHYKDEASYQADLIKKIPKLFPGAVVTKNDSGHIQGIPDLSVFYKNKFAWLEVKISSKASHQANQDYYIDKANREGSFGRFIYPENEKEVLDELQQSLQS